MSGGLDSTAVAAAAKDLLNRHKPDHDLRAYTVVFDRLIPDEERYWSGLAADHIRIPIHYLVADEYIPWQDWESPEQVTPGPIDSPFAALGADQLRDITVRHRVALTGFGGDPALYPSLTYFVELVKRLRFDRVFADAGRYWLAHRRLPPLNFRTWLRRRLRPPAAVVPTLPAWLAADFAGRMRLAERLAEKS